MTTWILAAHIALGTTALIAGPVAMGARKGPGLHVRVGEAYHWVVLGVCVSAGTLAVLDWGRLWWFLPIAVGSYAFALLGYLAAKRRWRGWLRFHIAGQGGSYIALVTALLVVNAGSSAGAAPAWAWLLPTVVGTLLLAWLQREVSLGRRPAPGLPRPRGARHHRRMIQTMKGMWVGLGAAVMFVVGCAPSPRSGDAVIVPQEAPSRVGRGGTGGAILIENERGVMTATIRAPAPEVYDAVARVYADLEIPVTMQDKVQGVVAADGFRMSRIDGRRNSRWLDCGMEMTGPLADNADVTATVTTLVESAGRGEARIHTQVDGTARRRASATGGLGCSTTGRLEARILEQVRELLGG